MSRLLSKELDNGHGFIPRTYSDFGKESNTKLSMTDHHTSFDACSKLECMFIVYKI